jgi:hypothetical protein
MTHDLSRLTTMSNLKLPAVVLIAFSGLCLVRASRGRFKPGFGFAYLDDVQTKAAERRTYFALGAVLAAVGIWMLLR